MVEALTLVPWQPQCSRWRRAIAGVHDGAAAGAGAAALASMLASVLASVLAYLEMLSEPDLEEGEHAELLGKAEACTVRIHHIIRELLDFSRAQRRDEGAPAAPFDPRAAALHAAGELDLIVLDYNGPRWGGPAEPAFLAAVEAGCGVSVVHAASENVFEWNQPVAGSHSVE